MDPLDEGVASEARTHSRVEQCAETRARGWHVAGDKQIAVKFDDLGGAQRPRLVLVGHPPRAARLAGVRTPSRGEPNLKRCRLNHVTNTDCEPVPQSAPRPAPDAVIRDLVTGPAHPHPRPRVRDAEADPGERYDR